MNYKSRYLREKYRGYENYGEFKCFLNKNNRLRAAGEKSHLIEILFLTAFKII